MKPRYVPQLFVGWVRNANGWWERVTMGADFIAVQEATRQYAGRLTWCVLERFEEPENR